MQTLINTPMTDSDFVKYLGTGVKSNIIVWGQLDDYMTLGKLLPNNFSYKIILIEEEKNSGHWVCIMRYNKIIEYFDPYGCSVFHHVDDMPAYINDQLDQKKEYFKAILNDALQKGFKIIYNKKRFQKYSDVIQTCGRHCTLRLLKLLDDGFPLEQYQEWMEAQQKKSSVRSMDELVTLFIK